MPASRRAASASPNDGWRGSNAYCGPGCRAGRTRPARRRRRTPTCRRGSAAGTDDDDAVVRRENELAVDELAVARATSADRDATLDARHGDVVVGRVDRDDALVPAP